MDNAHNIALSFICKHAPEHLAGDEPQLIQRTVDHLMVEFEVAEKVAREIALQAYAEHASQGRKEYIDLSRTTSHGLFLRIPGRSTQFFTAGELADYGKQKHGAQLP